MVVLKRAVLVACGACACGQPSDAFDHAGGVDAEMTVKLADGAGLAKMLDAKRDGAVAAHRAEPCERRRMAVNHCQQGAMRGQGAEQVFDMRDGGKVATGAGALRGGPACVQPIR